MPIIDPAAARAPPDIPALPEHFLGCASARLGRDFAISREAMVHMWSYDWPGNVRELENVVERVAILCEEATIDVKHLPPNLIAGTGIQTPEVLPSHGAIDLNAMVREMEGRLINQALCRTGGNKQAAARLLGLKRTTFAAKLRRCGVIAPPEGPHAGATKHDADQ